MLFIIEAVEYQVLKDSRTKVLFNALGTLKEGVVGVFCDLLWPSIAWGQGQGLSPWAALEKNSLHFCLCVAHSLEERMPGSYPKFQRPEC